MKKKKIMLVFGTRPEAIKMAPLVKTFGEHTDKFETTVAVTGQHREMLDQVLQLFNIEPDYDLNIMQKGQDLYDVTTRVLTGLRDIYTEANPDLVLVHGDTTTSMAAALAAFYKQIPVAHIEAGLRTHNIYSPWPEEINRQITSRIATYNFAPTPLSRENLIKEGVSPESITVTGNTVIDSLHLVMEKIKSERSLQSEIKKNLLESGLPVLIIEDYMSPLENSRPFVLITGHRRENIGEGFINIFRSIKTLSERYLNVDFIYPMHLNPAVRKSVDEVFEDGNISTNIHFIEPLDYLPFVYLMSQSALVLTDSGGIQEEAPGLGKPVLVMRDTTERPEAVDAGTVKLVGTNYEIIVAETSLLLDDEIYYDTMAKATNPYGDGTASEKITETISLLLD